MSERFFQVRQVRSAIGRPMKQRKTLKGLGLTRMGKSVRVKDTPANRGMIKKVVHLVEVVPLDGSSE